MGAEEPADSSPSGANLVDRLRSATVPALALLPVRFFFGLTFVYAGLDKLTDPAFFDAANPASINGQLAAFARVSPLAPLVRLSEPFALPLGLLIAVAEIAVGLGALTGLLFRLAALGGAAISLLFWLTASWATHPYYLGSDLPYAAGWLALAIAGDGGVLVPRALRNIGRRAEDDGAAAYRGVRAGNGSPRRDPWAAAGRDEEVSPARRAFLQAGALGALSLVLASLAVPLRLARPASTSSGAPGDAGAGTGSGASTVGTTGELATGGAPAATAPGATAPAAATPATGAGGSTALAIGKVADVERRGALRFTVPDSAPGSLPAGDPGVIVRLANGNFVAFDATCTHEGCRVGWDAADGVLLCPCHGAAFDPANHAAVLQGPTNTPLSELPITVDKASGIISLTA